jgi:hypothetical protein
MASGLSLSSEVQVFPCPNCKETINTSMQTCAFCSASIDTAAAIESAAETSRISHACSDASYLKIMCGTAIAFFFLRFVPLVMHIGWFGLTFLQVAVPVMTIRWWFKYGSIRTNDPDYAQARLSATYVTAGAGLLLIYTVLGLFVHLL